MRILEQTMVLEGSLVDDEGTCTAGNFVIRAKGSRCIPRGSQWLHHAGLLHEANGAPGANVA